MITRSTLLHLRIPFSYFLLPVFLFALSISPNLNASRLLWIFLIIHLFVYPASNGFNSYFDRDEQSIGGLKNPPPVTKDLYYASLLLDAVALLLALRINILFCAMIFIYGMVSKAYSHPSVRLKKYPFVGWITTGVFQGFFTFLMCYIGINNFSVEQLFHARVIVPALLTTLMLFANYPMTQVYQHAEDRAHGDETLSIRLGIKGTFVFTLICFAVTTVGFLIYFYVFRKPFYALAFLMALTPVVLYFLYWLSRVWKDAMYADHKHAMRLNFISATCLNIFFIYFFLDSSHVLGAVMAGY